MDYFMAALKAARHANTLVKNVTNRVNNRLMISGGPRNKVPSEQDTAKLNSVRIQKENPSQADILMVAGYAERLGMGNCGELAAVAYKYLLNQTTVRPLEYMNLTHPSDHSFVLLGRPEHLLPNQCGEDVIVCDPWYVWNPVYPITQVPQYMSIWLKPGAGYFSCAREE